MRVLLACAAALSLNACDRRDPAPAKPPAPVPAAAPVAAAAPAKSEPPPREEDHGLVEGATAAMFQGTWRVMRVELAPSRVQALVENDPAFMGARLDVRPDRLSWRAGGSAAAPDDVCIMPAFEPAPEPAGEVFKDRYGEEVLPEARRAPAATIACGEGPFGPEAAGGAIAVRLAPGRIALTWYDNAILILERVEP